MLDEQIAKSLAAWFYVGLGKLDSVTKLPNRKGAQAVPLRIYIEIRRF